MHDTTRDGRVRERIKAVSSLASEGWTAQMIAQALRIVFMKILSVVI